MEDTCVDSKVNKIQFDTITKNLDKIMDKQEDTVSRVVILERNNLVMTREFANLQKSQDQQQILTLKLDRETNAKIDYQFSNLLASISKTDDKNADKFDKIADGQEIILNKLGSIESNNKNKMEITKGKMVLYGSIFVALITILPLLIALI
ncbi:hypothetical protein LL033_11990 [Clostridium estertheticum]|uniref:hypothetical protein n=1 Tax=Clostridium estertheticum TaxID=238834 RepID=UPI001C0D3DAD|nr:hypothetical protein [Clostridium estertheticum]MBU3213513.1 hypothetical protein [Clostridium estertheticum]WAG57828.1 hypothetical protein LL033_11990 [Clostridium estertheticum]